MPIAHNREAAKKYAQEQIVLAEKHKAHSKDPEMARFQVDPLTLPLLSGDQSNFRQHMQFRLLRVMGFQGKAWRAPYGGLARELQPASRQK